MKKRATKMILTNCIVLFIFANILARLSVVLYGFIWSHWFDYDVEITFWKGVVGSYLWAWFMIRCIHAWCEYYAKVPIPEELVVFSKLAPLVAQLPAWVLNGVILYPDIFHFRLKRCLTINAWLTNTAVSLIVLIVLWKVVFVLRVARRLANDEALSPRMEKVLFEYLEFRSYSQSNNV